MITGLARIFRLIESGILIALLTGMITVAAYQVVARNFFDTGLVWGDALVRILVLWITLFGAMVASRKDEHIRIDLISNFFRDPLRPMLRNFTSLFTAGVSLMFAWYSGQLVYMDYQDAVVAFGNVPAWICESILPLGGLIISIRYLLHVFKVGNPRYEEGQKW